MKKSLGSSGGTWPSTPSPMFRADTQNFCSQVQQGSPADKAGLEDGDVIIEVNGETVQDEPYDDVVDRIKSSGEHVTLLVCGKKAYDYFQAKKIPIVSSMADPLVVTCSDGEGEVSAELENECHTEKERVSVTMLCDLLLWGPLPKQ